MPEKYWDRDREKEYEVQKILLVYHAETIISLMQCLNYCLMIDILISKKFCSVNSEINKMPFLHELLTLLYFSRSFSNMPFQY